ncbi:unnamed protein product [Sphenostylis stenocarpa]|uniref:Uncharacterized protein n=1 Tax=Sphenostylis stenocarpa TaxID=92480 RepID=A0AA86W1A1_9FABA|nr:unnamed protein product [Sphenostylis stenocarpa]
MGHENEPLDEFIEAHRTCFNDLMYFPTGNAYGLSSVAGNMEKVAALQNEFENMRNKLDDGNEKMVRFEKKVMVLTQGYELGLIFSNEGESLWPQVEATFKQMDIAATQLECFKVLQKQEQLAALNRINNLWAEVQKQKELEKTLQNRYGSLIEELEKMQNIMDQCRLQAQQEEEIETHNHAHESIETKTDETDVQSTENCEVVPHSAEDGNAQTVAVESSHDGTADRQVDIVQDQATSRPSYDKPHIKLMLILQMFHKLQRTSQKK